MDSAGTLELDSFESQGQGTLIWRGSLISQVHSGSKYPVTGREGRLRACFRLVSDAIALSPLHALVTGRLAHSARFAWFESKENRKERGILAFGKQT